MAAGVISLKPSAGFTRDLRRGVLQAGSRKALGNVRRRSRQVRTLIGDFLQQVFDQTDVAQSLRSKGSTDLPAHFGLSRLQGARLASNMGKVIKNSVKLTTRQFRNRGVVQVRAVNNDFQEFLGLPDASYISRQSGIAIPVMAWMLIDPNIDIGQAAYNIVFSGQNRRFDSRIDKVSRSGNAIMVTLKELGGGSGYLLPRIVRGEMGKNFIELTLSQPGVAQKVGQILFTAMKGGN